jgi:ribonucleoside-triphosphate reductase
VFLLKDWLNWGFSLPETPIQLLKNFPLENIMTILSSGPNGTYGSVVLPQQLIVQKRDGSEVSYNRTKIFSAVHACLVQNCGEPEDDADIIADQVTDSAERVLLAKATDQYKLGIELIQDVVENQLMAHGHHEAARQYILYRDERRRAREEVKKQITPELKIKFAEGNQYFKGLNPLLQQIQAFDKFSRFRYEWGRREVWPETVDRNMSYFRNHAQEKYPDVIPESIWTELKQSLLNLQASPSMRCVQMAGPALDRCQVGVYNCSFLVFDSPTAFAEDLYILMQGTGVGFSVEDEYAVDKWPRIKKQTGKKHHYVVDDTTEAWCEAWKTGIEIWTDGGDVDFDLSPIRKEGAPLKIKGGRSSGPGPLRDLLAFGRSTILGRQGKRLTSLNLHDMGCMTHRIVQMGGVRRASGISLSDLFDDLMRHAKRGEFHHDYPHRNQANNSAVYEEKPNALDFMEEWHALGRSGSGERGIFNRGSLGRQIPSRRRLTYFGCNPCGEIILRPMQFCNLSIAVIRPYDSWEEIRRKVELATIWGTLQASMTRFNYLRDEWRLNSEDEALLGVDLLGHLDHDLLRPNAPGLDLRLQELLKLTEEVNRTWALKIGIKPSAALTCGKPSGDSSAFFDTAAAFKDYHGQYYIRRLRMGERNPVAKVLQEYNIPFAKDYDKSGLLVFEIPARAPDNAIILGQRTAIEQLNHWLVYKKNFTEHNPSVTIYVKETEWFAVGHWVYENWDDIGGLSFYPYDDKVYPQTPYQTIDEEEFLRRNQALPTEIDWSRIVAHEDEDMTELAQTFACTGHGCTL